MPIPIADEKALPSGAKMFAGKITGQTLTYETTVADGRASGTVYEATLLGGKLSSIFKIPGTVGAPERITATTIDSAQKSVTLSLPGNGDEKAVSWQVIGAKQSQWIKFDDLVMVPDQAITMRLEYEGRRIVIDNDGPETTATLTVSGRDGEEPIEIGQVTIPAGENAAEFDLPGCSIDLPNVDGLNGWYVTPVTVELTGQDLSGRGIDRLEWSRDSVSWEDYSGPFQVDDEGENDVHYRAIDTRAQRQLHLPT